MTVYYREAKKRLRQLDIDYGYIAQHCRDKYNIKVSKSTIASCFSGRLRFDNNVCWAIFNLFKEDIQNFPKYFPMFGKD